MTAGGNTDPVSGESIYANGISVARSENPDTWDVAKLTDELIKRAKPYMQNGTAYTADQLDIYVDNSQAPLSVLTIGGIDWTEDNHTVRFVTKTSRVAATVPMTVYDNASTVDRDNQYVVFSDSFRLVESDVDKVAADQDLMIAYGKAEVRLAADMSQVVDAATVGLQVDGSQLHGKKAGQDAQVTYTATADSATTDASVVSESLSMREAQALEFNANGAVTKLDSTHDWASDGGWPWTDDRYPVELTYNGLTVNVTMTVTDHATPEVKAESFTIPLETVASTVDMTKLVYDKSGAYGTAPDGGDLAVGDFVITTEDGTNVDNVTDWKEGTYTLTVAVYGRPDVNATITMTVTAPEEPEPVVPENPSGNDQESTTTDDDKILSLVKTGDVVNALPVAGIGLLALVSAMIALIFKRRSRREEEE